jgi:hypothetical protein
MEATLHHQSLTQGEETAMLEAVQVNIALWGMIICLAVKAAQWIEYAF